MLSFARIYGFIFFMVPAIYTSFAVAASSASVDIEFDEQGQATATLHFADTSTSSRYSLIRVVKSTYIKAMNSSGPHLYGYLHSDQDDKGQDIIIGVAKNSDNPVKLIIRPENPANNLSYKIHLGLEFPLPQDVPFSGGDLALQKIYSPIDKIRIIKNSNIKIKIDNSDNLDIKDNLLDKIVSLDDSRILQLTTEYNPSLASQLLELVIKNIGIFIGGLGISAALAGLFANSRQESFVRTIFIMAAIGGFLYLFYSFSIAKGFGYFIEEQIQVVMAWLPFALTSIFFRGIYTFVANMREKMGT